MPKKLLRNKRRRITKKNKKRLRKKQRKSRKRRNLKGGGVWEKFKDRIGFGEKENPEKKAIIDDIKKEKTGVDKVNDKATEYLKFMTDSIKEAGNLAEKNLKYATDKATEQIMGTKGSEATKDSVKKVINLFKETTTTGVQEAFKKVTEEAKQNNECPCCKRKFDEDKPAEAKEEEKPAGAGAEKPAGAEADKSVEEADKSAEKDDSLNLSFSDFDKKD